MSESALARSQYKAAGGVLMLGLVQGITVGWLSPAITKLQQGEGPFVPSVSETSSISSTFSLGMLAGFFLSGVVSGLTGRRNTLLLAPVCVSGAVFLTFTATTAEHLCLSRLLSGVAHSVTMGFASLYVAEMATTAKRAELALAITLLLPIGQFIAYAVGPMVPFRVQALLPVPFLITAFFMLLNWMPESPFYLATTGQNDKLLAALLQVRAGQTADAVRKEAAAIQRTVKEQQKDAKSWRDVFSSPASRKAAVMVLPTCSALAVLGVTTVLSFTTQIFQESGTPLSAEVSSMLLLAINVVMVLVTMRLIDRLGRVTLLALSALGNAVSLAALAGFFFAREVLHADVSGVQWIPLASLVSFTASGGLGIFAIPGMLMSELLGQRAKAVLGPVTGLLIAFTAFVVNKNFLPVGKSLGFWVPFAFFAFSNLAYAIFVFVCVPETKGKSLAEVQDMLRSGSDVKSKKRQ